MVSRFVWVLDVTCVCSSVREPTRGARLTYVCSRGVKGAISTALTSVVGYADPPGDGALIRSTSVTSPKIPLPWSVFSYLRTFEGTYVY